MKNMKRISLMVLIFLVSVQFSIAQSSQVMSAFSNLGEYNLTKDGAYLVDAKSAIDKASVHESTSLLGKTWYYKGMIYHTLSKDTLLRATDKTYLSSALESFEKALSIEDKKFRDQDNCLDYIRAISGDVFNAGVDRYQKGEFEGAYNDFFAMKEINQTLKANNIDLVVDTERTVSNAASAAEQAGMTTEAIAAYEDLLTINNEANNFRFLAALLKKTGFKEKAMSVLDNAALAHPENADIIIDQLNYYIEDGKLADAIDKLDRAIELQPENDMLYFVKGNAYDKNGDNEMAIVEYENAIRINPENDKALYNAGAMYFLGANKFITEMNDLGYKEVTKYNELDAKRKEMYLKAKPYFEKVLVIFPEDDASSKALFKINAALDKK
jgi:tetratricopeptide (TPR) repeat protein